ncbi:MAG: hypothetical protein GDA56_02110 [Hormoscilla sp. GM7CHS1pb]|nr:hypothetical protein [Hormoscilla sp. GM7CHS1pb]
MLQIKIRYNCCPSIIERYQWQPATWSDYLVACEYPTSERMRIFFIAIAFY